MKLHFTVMSKIVQLKLINYTLEEVITEFPISNT